KKSRKATTWQSASLVQRSRQPFVFTTSLMLPTTTNGVRCLTRPAKATSKHLSRSDTRKRRTSIPYAKSCWPISARESEGRKSAKTLRSEEHTSELQSREKL